MPTQPFCITISNLCNDTERQIIGLAAGGHTNAAIALKLGINRDKVKWHLRRISRMVGGGSRTRIIILCLVWGYITLDDVQWLHRQEQELWLV